MALKKYEVVSSSKDTIVLQKAASPIKKAWFIPDENTDFEKLCLLRMEFTSPPKDPVTIALWARYKGTEYDLDHKREIKVTGTVSEEHLSLYYVDKHQADIVNNGEKDAKAYYYAKITANGAVCKSEYLEMPIAGQVYKKGDYDDTVATDAKHPKSGDNYKAGKGITVLQRMLISSKFLDITSPTGSYGPKTEEAVKAFQTSALGKERQKRGVLINVSVSFKGKTDGIADISTQEELKYWSRMEYCKPSNSVAINFSSSLDEGRKNLLSTKSRDIITTAAKAVGYQQVTINSTIRYPRQQASAMYDNLKKGNRLSYAAPGMAVTAVYDDSQKKKHSKEDTIQKMVDKIEEYAKDGKRVSLHCVSEDEYKKMNIVDIGIPKTKTADFLRELAKSDSVVKILHDISGIKDEGKIKLLKKEPCIHVEIKQ
ncbi:MAG: peptidoglycan-binding domain-containing protein [Fibrobacterota bacterium]|nr:peptidoglycan-binding domain-containing protein [Chitinispirillaceae bacterium]